MERPLALVVDRDLEVRGRVRALLAEAGIDALEAASGPEALEVLRTRPVRIALVDPGAPGVLTTDFLSRALRARPSLVPMILATGANPTEAVQLLDDGAYDLVDRALEPGAVRVAAVRALSQNRLLVDLAELREQLRDRTGYRRLVGRSAAMEKLRERLERHASLDVPLHFEGEEGVGKELAAHTVHEMSPRCEAPFASLDCSSLGEEALEAELFGHGKGTFPGDQRSAGVLESADGGSVFLREIEALPGRLQSRLLDALRQRRFRRVGGSHDVPLNVRVFSSSRVSLEAAAREGKVRDDLRRTVAVTVVRVPAVRDRRDDVAVLARHFLETICEINDLAVLHLSPEALQSMEAYPWPGNVRELRNAMEQAVILATDRIIRPRELPRVIQGSGSTEEPEHAAASGRPFRVAKREVVDAFEKAYLSDLLRRHAGNVTAASQQAGMLRSALQRLLRKHELRSVSFRSGSRSRSTEHPS